MSIDQKCERCRTVEDIPTWQFFKFEDDVHYDCRVCFQDGKIFYFSGPQALKIGEKREKPSPGQMSCDRCCRADYIPKHQKLRFGDEVDKDRYVCQPCWELFKGWYYRGARAMGSWDDSSK